LTEEKVEFTRPLLILGNLAILAWIFLAFFSVLFYNPLYGWLYLLALAFIIYGILRRLGCRNCYMCKSCTSGFGRLAGAFFGKEFVKKQSIGNRIGVIAFVYFLLLPLPAAFLILAFWAAFSYVEVFVLVCLLAVAAYSFTTWLHRSAARQGHDLGEVLKS
jgi:hypothetical protein